MHCILRNIKNRKATCDKKLKLRITKLFSQSKFKSSYYTAIVMNIYKHCVYEQLTQYIAI